jgi:hypothetical protein
VVAGVVVIVGEVVVGEVVVGGVVVWVWEEVVAGEVVVLVDVGSPQLTKISRLDNSIMRMKTHFFIINPLLFISDSFELNLHTDTRIRYLIACS